MSIYVRISPNRFNQVNEVSIVRVIADIRSFCSAITVFEIIKRQGIWPKYKSGR